ncbi:HEAT repeat domain-containing protein [Gimesia sp.]|uniref:HEAT repeat domain-containing protein n=1 Tax=Gimesia sp. TaxID=2024833 RepID=UPI003A907EEC
MGILQDDSIHHSFRFPLAFTCNRSFIGCLAFLICITIIIVLVWMLAPNEVVLRYDLESNQLRRSTTRVRKMGPSAVPIISEYMSHNNAITRLNTVITSMELINSHPEESDVLVPGLCKRALHDPNKTVRIYALLALRSVKFESKEIDNTALQLIANAEDDIRLAAEELLLSRINVSSNLCNVKDQLKSQLRESETNSDEARVLKAILKKCESP